MKPKLTKRKCKSCGEVFQKRQPLQYVCSPKCAVTYQKLLKKNKEAKEWRDKKKVMKEGLLTHKDYIQLLQRVFNKFIRLRDKDEPCISCYTPANADIKWDAGHMYPATYQYLRFNEDNTNKQCSYNCNLNKSGNFPEYVIRLRLRIGEDRVQKLHNDRHKKLDLSIPEIKELIKEYKLKIKEL